MNTLMCKVKTLEYKAGIQRLALWLGVMICVTLLGGKDVPAAIQAQLKLNDAHLFDIDHPPTGKYRLSDSWSYGSKLTLERSEERNYDLDTTSIDDYDLFITELEIVFAYVPSHRLDAFIDLEFTKETEFEDDGENHDVDTELNIKELNITFRNLWPNFILKVGRQEFKDQREWLYDEELDAIRLYYRLGNFDVEASVSGDNLFKRDLLNKDKHENIYNYFLLVDYHFNKYDSNVAYLFMRDDQEDDLRPLWLGLRTMRKTEQGLTYWLEGAYVTGKGEINSTGYHQFIDAYAFDFGGTYVFDMRLKPSISLGWAYGSGDDNPDSYTDKNFRQTGLHDNNGRFNGVTRFKYYGEVFEPELSNMHIITVGLGVRLLKKTSIDLIYHAYHTNEILDSNLEMDPTGDSHEIGEEIDIVIGFREIKNLTMEWVFGEFLPGTAFGGKVDKATLINFKLDYKF